MRGKQIITAVCTRTKFVFFFVKNLIDTDEYANVQWLWSMCSKLGEVTVILNYLMKGLKTAPN